jgi:Limiting CO2-inducible proteins B/C beta carbonyic anhydrases
VKRTAGALGTIALATSVFPNASLAAAKKAAAPVKAALKVNPDVVKAVGIFVGGSAVALLGRWIFGGAGKGKATISKIESVFPGALKNKDLISKVTAALKKHGYGKKSSLVATSFGSDEVNRVLERDFTAAYDKTFRVSKRTIVALAQSRF